MNLSHIYRRVAALALGALLLVPGQALAWLPGFPENLPAARSRTTSFRPLYLEQLHSLEARGAKLRGTPTCHVVLEGETLSQIARKHGLRLQELVKRNNLPNANFIRAGQVLSLAKTGPAQAEVLHTLRQGETVWGLSRAYQVGSDLILAANSIKDPARLLPGQKLVIPGSGASVSRVALPAREALAVSQAAPRAAADFIWPVNGRITSAFGPRWGSFHAGLDIARRYGSPILAVADGTVVDVGWRGSFGHMIRIDHQNGWESLYAHASRIHVQRGDTVSAGQQIACIGETGNATGPHLHLELIFRGQHRNPLKYLPQRSE